MPAIIQADILIRLSILIYIFQQCQLAALKHHIIDRDGTLRRMLPFLR